ncbi:CHAT domain-containing protein [Kallotenue papyrolyticum]|uniref:CHAT domain-containing protein n=1 Tax=Kallotenue papyrolyticum TaxID=1325125 RepID=UPI0004785DE5|nr:CHAT domain-containing protein [Kallotenue papyrolyticum]
MTGAGRPPQALRYLDFEIEIGAALQARSYPVAVLRSPAGEARATLVLPFDRLALDNHLLALRNALLRSGVVRRRIVAPDEQAVQRFGAALFDSLFAGELRSRFDTSLRLAEDQGCGLRLKLRINAPELACLPWELLFDARQGEYVALSRATPIVRYLELPQTLTALPVAPPLRILGLIASPRDLPPLDVDLERQRVEAAVADLRRRGLVELTWLAGQTWRDLQRAMRGGPWHVLHFVGHGDFDRAGDEGVIALLDEQGRAYRLSATQLGRLLDDHFPLRLALLNACEGATGSERDLLSSTAATLVRRGVPAVLAMQNEISDDAAIELAHTFYEALADGLPVDAAVAEARKAICLAVPHSLEWSTPVLYLRAPDGRIFEVESPAKTSPPAAHHSPDAGQPPPPLAARQMLQPAAPLQHVTAAPARAIPEPPEPRRRTRTWLLMITLGTLLSLTCLCGLLFYAAASTPSSSVLVPPAALPGSASAAPTPAWRGRLVFARELVAGQPSTSELIIADLAQGGELQITNNAVPDYLPRWAPDGQRIAYTSALPEAVAGGDYDIWLMDATGASAHPWLRYPAWETYPAWAPDQRWLALATTAETNGFANSEIHLADAAGNLERLTVNLGRDEWPSWSPDGRWIVHGSAADVAMDLYLIDPFERVDRPLIATPADENQPAWSPDGQWIVFVRRASPADRYGDLWLTTPDGQERRLTATGDAADPAWAPDGSAVVFSRAVDRNQDGQLSPDEDADLWAVTLADGALWPLVQSPWHEWGASWSW